MEITHPQYSKYLRGKIYKITDNGYNECYIGSTIQALCDRMSTHRRDYRNYKKTGTLRFTASLLFDKYGVENCKIELIERFQCENKEDLLAREGYYIGKTDCVNKYVSGRTRKEYYHQNRERKLNQAKDYRQKHLQQIKDYKKAYNALHRDELLEKAKEKITCDVCGVILNRQNKKRHERSQIHLTALGKYVKPREEVTEQPLSEKNEVKFKEYNQERYERLKPQFLEKARKYREEHRDYRNEKIECQHCDVKINRTSMRRHIRRHHPETINN